MLNLIINPFIRDLNTAYTMVRSRRWQLTLLAASTVAVDILRKDTELYMMLA